MRTNIEIDDKLLKKVMRSSGVRTKKAAVETAMRLYVQMQEQEKALRALRGIGQWEGDLEQSRLSRFAGVEMCHYRQASHKLGPSGRIYLAGSRLQCLGCTFRPFR